MADKGKNMSSRLLNMKFMQRASAASPTASPSTPGSERPSKRQRLSDAVSPDVRAFQEAQAQEEAKRNAFIERAAAEAGETKWVLSVQEDDPKSTQSPLRIVSAGYGAIDSNAPLPTSDDEEEHQSVRPSLAGRRSFGKFNKTIERQQNPDLSSSESEAGSESNPEESDDSDLDSEDEADQLIKAERKAAADKLRAERRAQKKQETENARKLAERRRSKEVNLNKVGGISNANNKGKQGNTANMVCHTCNQKGHIQRECPQKKRRDNATY